MFFRRLRSAVLASRSSRPILFARLLATCSFTSIPSAPKAFEPNPIGAIPAKLISKSVNMSGISEKKSAIFSIPSATIPPISKSNEFRAFSTFSNPSFPASHATMSFSMFNGTSIKLLYIDSNPRFIPPRKPSSLYPSMNPSTKEKIAKIAVTGQNNFLNICLKNFAPVLRKGIAFAIIAGSAVATAFSPIKAAPNVLITSDTTVPNTLPVSPSLGAAPSANFLSYAPAAPLLLSASRLFSMSSSEFPVNVLTVSSVLSTIFCNNSSVRSVTSSSSSSSFFPNNPFMPFTKFMALLIIEVGLSTSPDIPSPSFVFVLIAAPAFLDTERPEFPTADPIPLPDENPVLLIVFVNPLRDFPNSFMDFCAALFALRSFLEIFGPSAVVNLPVIGSLSVAMTVYPSCSLCCFIFSRCSIIIDTYKSRSHGIKLSISESV